MDHELRETVARIDENVKHVKAGLAPLLKRVQDHTIDITVLKRDRWWLFTLAAIMSTALGAGAPLLIEWLRQH